VFKRIGLRLPFSGFERELLTEINVTPAQLHPNSWAFVSAFGILYGYFGQPPFVDIFLHFFEVKKQGKSLWVSFSGIAGRILLSLFQQSYKDVEALKNPNPLKDVEASAMLDVAVLV